MTADPNGSEEMTEQLYKFVWRDGKTHVGRGRDPADAMRRLGFGHGALPALDYWERVSEKENQISEQASTENTPRLPCGCPLDSGCNGYHATGAA